MTRRISNSELHEDIVEIKQDVRALREKLLDPDLGVISRVNRNTSFRHSANKVLWSVWIAIVGIIARLMFWN
tara:strand:- start:25115 stop:25330 length:216 start_codon:yes stop_codon:yes gene_type:complete